MLSTLYLLLFTIGRFWLPYLPIYILFLSFYCNLIDLKNYKNAKIYFIGFLVVSGLFINYYENRKILPNELLNNNRYNSEIEASKWIVNNVPDYEYIVCRKPQIAYLSNRKWIATPWFENSSEFLTYMKHFGLKYFILGEYEMKLRPFLRDDFITGEIYNYAEKLHHFANGDIFIFSIR